MKLFICCSKWFYNRIPPIKKELEKLGHEVTLPNSYEDPFREEELKKLNPKEHIKWKANMLKEQINKIEANDGILILNFEKKGQQNYIGGATFLEMYEAWKQKKYLFLYNKIPLSILTDEIKSFNPSILNQDLTKIKNAMDRKTQAEILC